MAKNRPYSLCIGIEKLRSLKRGKSNIVSHPKTRRWTDFINKKQKKVRFFDQNTIDSGTFDVDEIIIAMQCGEEVVKIKIK